MYNASGQNYNVKRSSSDSGTNLQNVPQEQSVSQQASQNVRHNVLQNLSQSSQQMLQMMQNDPTVPRVPTVTYDPNNKEDPVRKDDVRNIYETPKMANLPIEPSVPNIPNPSKVQDNIPNMPDVTGYRKTYDDDSDSDSDTHERIVHRNVRTSKLRSTQDEPLNTPNSPLFPPSREGSTFLYRENRSIAFDGALRASLSHCHLLLDSHSTGI